MQGVSGGHANGNYVLCTPGFIRSMSGSVAYWASLNLEVVLGKAQAQYGENKFNQAQGLGESRCAESPTNVENYFQPICGLRLNTNYKLSQVVEWVWVSLGNVRNSHPSLTNPTGNIRVKV